MKYGKERMRADGVPLALVLVLDVILRNLEKYVRKRDYRKRKLPSIMLITLPKSGSMYIMAVLSGSCGLHPVFTKQNAFPFSQINETDLKKFAIGCSIDQAHYMPSTKNLTLLNKHHINKIVVHFRDPRQALVSLVHYFDKEHERRNVFCDQDIDLPLDYFEKSFEEKTYVAIDLYYPWVIAFIDRWLAYGLEGVPQWGGDVLFTEFRKMKNDSDVFFEDITWFYGIPPVVRQRPVGKLRGALHYRKGEEEEWRQALTPDQIEKTSAMITDGTAERFGWSKSLTLSMNMRTILCLRYEA